VCVLVYNYTAQLGKETLSDLMFAVEGSYLNLSFKTIFFFFFFLPEACHLPITNLTHSLHFYNSGHTLYESVHII